MGWPHVPAGWVSAFTAGAHSAPLVEVRALNVGTGWNIITAAAGVALVSADDIEYSIDWHSFGGVSKAKDIRLKFISTDGKISRGGWFDSAANVAAGWPILVRISYDAGTSYRTVYSGRIQRIEKGDDASATLVCREWLSWWLENHSLDDYWAYTPKRYVTKKPHAGSNDLPGGGACYFNNCATAAEKYTDPTRDDYAYNWPATYLIWAEPGIPAAWLTSGQITKGSAPTVRELSGSKTYYSTWPNAMTIHSRPKSMLTQDWLHDRGTKGVNWVGRAEVKNYAGAPWDSALMDVRDYRLYSISPPFLSYGVAEQAFTHYNSSGSVVTTGGVIHIGPDPESWKEGNAAEDNGDYIWASWHNQGTGMANFAVYAGVSDGQNGILPHPQYNYFGSREERNEALFGDAREGPSSAYGTEEAPWAYACYSPPMATIEGNPALKVPDVYIDGAWTTPNTHRANPVDAVFAILSVLGGYLRPPTPEVDGEAVYDLQNGFTTAALETDGYVQDHGAGAASPLWDDVLADYLEDGSRMPSIKHYMNSYYLGAADNLLQPGKTFAEILDEMGKACGLWIFQSPFGQIDMDVAKPLDGFYHAASVTLPVFRASTSGDDPNIDQDSADRNCWGIKWKDLADKAVKQATLKVKHISEPAAGVTVLDDLEHTVDGSDWHGSGYSSEAEREVEHTSAAVLSGLGSHQAARRYIGSYCNALTEVSFEAPLVFFSDNRDRTSGTDCFLRIGRPMSVIDANHNSSGTTVITGVAFDVTAGTMKLTGVSGDVGPAIDNCYPDKPFVEFGSVGVGLYSDETITLTNDSGSAISGTITLNGNSQWSFVSGNTYSMASGDTHAVVIRFTPTSLGTSYAGIESDSDCTMGGINTKVMFSGHGFELPICFGPRVVGFREFYVGYYIDQTFEVFNYGTGSLDGFVEFPAENDYTQFALVDPVDSTITYGAGSTTDIAISGVTTGESETITVRFFPQAAGEFTAKLVLNTNVDCTCYGNGIIKQGIEPTSLNEIILIGQGIPIPACFVNPKAMSFGQVTAGNTSTVGVSLSNTGTFPLAGTAVISQMAGGVFSIDAADLAPTGSGSSFNDEGDGTWTWEVPPGGQTINWDIKVTTDGNTSARLYNGALDFGAQQLAPTDQCALVGLLVVVQSQGSDCAISDLGLHFGTIEVNDTAVLTVDMVNITADETIIGTANCIDTNDHYQITNATVYGTSTASDVGSGAWDYTCDSGGGNSIKWEITYAPDTAQTDFGAIEWGDSGIGKPCHAVGLIGKAVNALWDAPDQVDFGTIKSDMSGRCVVTVMNHHMEGSGDLRITATGAAPAGTWGVFAPDETVVTATDYFTVTDFFDGAEKIDVTCWFAPANSVGTFSTQTLRVSRYVGVAEQEYVDVPVRGVAYDYGGCHIGSSSNPNSVNNKIQEGDVLVSTNGAEHEIRVYNLRTTPLTLFPTIVSVGDNWKRTAGHALNTGHVIAQGSYLTITVQLQLGSTDRGVQLGKMTFGAECGDTVTLFGRGVRAGDIVSIIPTGLLFSTASGTPQSLSVAIYNSSESLTVTGTAAFDGDPPAVAHYGFSAGGGAISLAPGSTHTITVLCSPAGDTYIGWAFVTLGSGAQTLAGMYIPLMANITDTTRDTNWATLTGGSNADSLHAHDHGALDGIGDDDHTIYLLADGTRAMAGDLNLDAHHITSDASIDINMPAGSTLRTLRIRNAAGGGSADLNVQNDIIVGGTVDGVNVSTHAVDEDAHHDHWFAAQPFHYGQRNTDSGGGYWDWAGLISGGSADGGGPALANGSVVGVAWQVYMASVTATGEFQFEVWIGAHGTAATFRVESVVSGIAAAGYYGNRVLFTPGDYPFNAGDNITAFGRFADSLAGTWRNGSATIYVLYD